MSKRHTIPLDPLGSEEPRERGILFQPWKVRRILEWNFERDGDMQTRRLLKEQPIDVLRKGPKQRQGVTRIIKGRRTWFSLTELEPNRGKMFCCRYGEIGDMLYVKETWAYPINGKMVGYRATYPPPELADIAPDVKRIRWKSSLFMPKKHARIWLEITDVRVQRVGEISEGDAVVEGVYSRNSCHWYGDKDEAGDWKKANEMAMNARTAYSRLWDKINGKGSWMENPWVWAISFRRVKP